MKKAISVLMAACVLAGLLCAGAVPAGAESEEIVDAVLEIIEEDATPGAISASGVGSDIGQHAISGLWMIALPFIILAYACKVFINEFRDPYEEDWGAMVYLAVPFIPLLIPICAVIGLLQVLISPITGYLQSVGWVSKAPLRMLFPGLT